MRGRPLALAVFALLIAASPLIGQNRPNSYEFWPHGGFVFFDSELDLQDNFYYGVRMGFNVSPHVEIELLGNFANSRANSWPMVGDVKLFEPGVNVTWNFPLQDEARWRWVPYLTTGLARSRFDYRNSVRQEDTTINFGGGIRWFGNENVGFRSEIRDVHEVDGDYDNIQLLTGITIVSGGKLRDSDGDTVPDKHDECPNTPMGCIVDRVGCQKDGDGDGICDGLDECPDTKQGCEVLKNGCDKDSDGDGVCDGLDKCPGTPAGCVVDADGCPVDSDGDTVCDGVDKCPNTPAGCRVDAKGCPTDQDGDTVCDGVDRCPNTARGCKVDARGCPLDSDGDGVCDGIDECPGTPRGMEVDEVGCELEIVIQDVLFDFDRASIKPVFVPILEKVNKAMVDNARMRIALHGHTDSVGPDNYNIRLSQRRGESVMKWLVGKGIAETRLEVVAHGECCPVADNQTYEGRAKNRRVEFKRIR